MKNTFLKICFTLFVSSTLSLLKAQCPTLTAVQVTPSAICSGTFAALSATASGASIGWYTAPSGGNLIGTSASGANFSVFPAVTTTYYAAPITPTTLIFGFTGAVQNFTVPTGITTLSVELRGANGGSGYQAFSTGGLAGIAIGTLAVTPGSVLQINVGGAGSNATSSSPGVGGFNGGGNGAFGFSYGGGGGGGASDIRITPYGLSNRIAVAGGGGGAGYSGSQINQGDKGGNGGGLVGGAGTGSNVVGGSTFGGAGGGTQSAGGVGGTFVNWCTSNAGVLGQGGLGGCSTSPGGGGGGGYYGGGGGSWTGGGGGSAYLPGGTFSVGAAFVQNGTVFVTYNACLSAPRIPVVVNVNTSPTITTNNTVMCIGSSFSISPSGATSYTIQGGNTVVSPNTTTTYSVIGTNSTGCLSNVAFSTVQIGTPTITVNSATICNGTNFTITPSGASTYTIQGGNAVVSPSVNTTYTVIGTSTSGCISANTATSSVVVTTCTPASALSFDGTNDYAVLPGAIGNSISGGTELTIEYWFKGTNLQSGVRIQNGGDFIVAGWGIATHPQFIISTDGGAASGVIIGTTTVVNDNNWHHIACVWSKNNHMTTYLDGLQQNTRAAANVNLPTFSNVNYNIGTYSNGEFMNGSIDEVRIWNRALCQAEIVHNKNGEFAAPRANLIAYYKFNQGFANVNNTSAGTILTDASGNNYNGTLVNFALNGTVSNWITPGGVVSGSTVTAFPGSSISIAGANAFCNSGNATLTATGNVTTYTWTSGPNTNSFVVTPTITTTYSVIGTATNGCRSNLAVATITINNSPTISVNSGSICAGQTFVINPSGANTYTIQGGNNNVTPASSTNYTVTGTGSNGCVAVSAVTASVTVNANPTITVNSGSICEGQNFVINPSGANTYTIQGGSATVTPVSSSNYTISGTSAAGCVALNNATSSITVNSNPTVSIANYTICSASTITLNPTGASTYTFSNGSNTITPNSNTTISVIGTSSAGCVSSNTAISNIFVNPTPTITVNSGTICAGSNFVITPSGAITYTIQGGNATVTPASSTNYTVNGTSAGGCLAQSAATSSVTVNANPTVSVNNGTICMGSSFVITPSGASTYTIEGGNATVTPNTTTSYTVSGISAQGCLSQNTATSNVVVNPNSTVSVVTTNTMLCIGETATLFVSGVLTQTWNTQANTASIVISPTATTIYTVVGNDNNNCQNANTFTQVVDACTGIAKVLSPTAGLDFDLFPNPSSGLVTLRLNQTENISLRVVSILGQEVYTQHNLSEIQIVDLKVNPRGIYFIQLLSQEKVIASKKLVKD